MGEQAEQLERVATRISRAIFAFRDSLGERRQFHADELRKFVNEQTGLSAPGSADRVLRDLRQDGLIDYRVISRRGSLYEFIIQSEQLKMPWEL